MVSNNSPFGSEPLSLVCPNGHTSWIISSGHYWCHDCSQLIGVDPEFDELHDPETGEPLSDSEVSNT